MADTKTSVYLCNVNITPSNEVDFDTKEDQYNYFYSKSIMTIADFKMIDKNNGEIKIRGYVDNINANYGFFTNTYQGTSKTYYFWITQKKYVSRNVTKIEFSIDVFQTWLFDFVFNPCMVERKHVTDDRIGVNTYPEEFELGDYVSHNRRVTTELTGNPCFILGYTDGDHGGVFGKTYCGYTCFFYKFEDRGKMQQKIKELCEQGKADSIAFIFMFPYNFFDFQWDSGTQIGGYEGVITREKNYNFNNDFSKRFYFLGDSYTPYNNKMYCYPFNFLTSKNSSGSNVVLKFENFEDLTNIKFDLDGVLTMCPTFTLTPRNYEGKGFALEDSIECNDFGLCSWNNDNYANWYANHKNSIQAQSNNAINSYNASKKINSNNYQNALQNRDTQAMKGAISTTANTLGNLAKFNFIGAIGSGVTGALNTMIDYSQNTDNARNTLENASISNETTYENEISSLMASVKDAQVQPNTCKGDTSSCGLDIARGTSGFIIEQTMIKPEYARKIDDYFQMFGYQVNSVEVPQMKTRKYWNYLKTTNCKVYGNIPHEDIGKINELFNNGITIWHNPGYLYKYHIKNEILE